LVFGLAGEVDTIGSNTVSITVPYGTVVTGLTPTITVSDGATISPASRIAMSSNPETYTVTAQDGQTQRTYTVTVLTAPSSDATLSNLTISQGTLTPSFASGTISYTDSVANSVTSVNVTPTRNQANATITVNGTSVAAESASGPINLNVGSNTITIVVTAQDGVTLGTYIITVNRNGLVPTLAPQNSQPSKSPPKSNPVTR